jgi:hypothetical protein
MWYNLGYSQAFKYHWCIVVYLNHGEEPMLGANPFPYCFVGCCVLHRQSPSLQPPTICPRFQTPLLQSSITKCETCTLPPRMHQKVQNILICRVACERVWWEPWLVFKIKALIWIFLWRALKYQLFSWRVGSNPRHQSKYIEMKYKTHIKLVHEFYGTCF